MYGDERGRHGWLPEQCHRRALWRILKCEYASGRKGSWTKPLRGSSVINLRFSNFRGWFVATARHRSLV